MNVEDKGETICLNAHLTKILNRLLKCERNHMRFALNKEKVLVGNLFYEHCAFITREVLMGEGNKQPPLC